MSVPIGRRKDASRLAEIRKLPKALRVHNLYQTTVSTSLNSGVVCTRISNAE